MQDELYIRVKQALTWLKRNQGILQKDIADKMGMSEASFTRALARIKEKNDEDFVISFHSVVSDFISLDYLLYGTGDLIIENESTFHAKTASTSNIDPSSQVNATISAYVEAIESLKRELRTKDELLAEKDSRLAFVSGNLIIRHEKNGELIKEEKYIVNIQGNKTGLDYLQNLQIKYKKPYSTVSTVFRKKVFLDRNYKEMYEVSDVCMYMNALLCGDAFILKEIVAVYRFHENNLTYSLPKEFMMRVIKEKERVYLDSVGLLDDSIGFWYEHYRKTYLFYREGKPSRKNKFSFLFWGLSHSHASKKVVSFCIKEMLKAFIISNE